jgi:hypothetical protein
MQVESVARDRADRAHAAVADRRSRLRDTWQTMCEQIRTAGLAGQFVEAQEA